MATATIEGIRTLSPIPAQGEQYLSVNLALVDLTALLDIAKALDFKPELVQIQYRSGIQVHALLWQGKMSDAPSDLDDRIDALADRINNDAIHSAQALETMGNRLEGISTSLDTLTVQGVQPNEIKGLTRKLLQALDRQHESINNQTQAINRHLQVAQQQSANISELSKLVATQASTVDFLLRRLGA